MFFVKFAMLLTINTTFFYYFSSRRVINTAKDISLTSSYFKLLTEATSSKTLSACWTKVSTNKGRSSFCYTLKQTGIIVDLLSLIQFSMRDTIKSTRLFITFTRSWC